MILPSIALYLDARGRLLICAGSLVTTYEEWRSGGAIARARI